MSAASLAASASAAATASTTKLQRVGRVVFIRHGESIWNIKPVRFTGWADVPLTDRGLMQASAAGRCLQQFGIYPDAAFTSLLRRSKDSLEAIANASGREHYTKIPIINSWRLNERHYGALVGLSKEEAQDRWGDIVMDWRRSWDIAPPKMNPQELRDWSNSIWAKPTTMISEPGKRKVVLTERGITIPETESLQDCCNRALPLWIQGVAPRVARGETVLIVAHANSIRAMVKHIDVDTVTIENIKDVNIPSAVPLIYDFVVAEPNNDISNSNNNNNSINNHSNNNHNNIDSSIHSSPHTSPHSSSQHMHHHHESIGVDYFARNKAFSSPSIKPFGEASRLGMRGKFVVSRELTDLNLKTVSDPRNETINDERGKSFYYLVEKSFEDVKEYCDTGSGSDQALVITDGKGKIEHFNQTWENLCGFKLDEVKGKSGKFLQGPLTDKEAVADMNERLFTGLYAKASMVNYRRSGAAFVNDLTIIPMYDWLATEKKSLESEHAADTHANTHANANTHKGVHVNRKDFPLGMAPSHFIAKLEKTKDRHDLPPLTPEQMAARNLKETILK